MSENRALRDVLDVHRVLSGDLILMDREIRNDPTLNDEQRAAGLDALWKAWEDSSQAVVRARMGILGANTAEVESLMTELADARVEMENALAAHGQTVDVLRKITRAVSLAVRLVSGGG
jgi:hypothetical protein